MPSGDRSVRVVTAEAPKLPPPPVWLLYRCMRCSGEAVVSPYDGAPMCLGAENDAHGVVWMQAVRLAKGADGG